MRKNTEQHKQLRERLSRSVIVDGPHIALDLHGSEGPYIRDLYDSTEYLDFATFYASLPLGMNHPDIKSDPELRERLLVASLNKVANPDYHSEEVTEFVETFVRVVGDPEMPKLFFVEGGALAVENAIKAAFDWKSRRNERAGLETEQLEVMHLEGAFHGRSGYTLSLTNTEANKIERFPKFNWPRIPVPDCVSLQGAALEEAERLSLEAAERFFLERPGKIACVLAEPIQGEGGDRHMRGEFLRELQDLAHRHDALFVLDEVQTGCGMTGRNWCYQKLGLKPDIVAFAKKLQVGGIMAGRRVLEEKQNVFTVPGRISSTWGGGLVDMVRATLILDIIERDKLVENASHMGERLLAGLKNIKDEDFISAVRGSGLMVAFDLPDGLTRDAVFSDLEEREHLLVLRCGSKSIRLRPPLNVRPEDVDRCVSAIASSVNRVRLSA
jgi:L-lysine 6-transaminase